MAAKKNAVDRVIAELKAEQEAIYKTIQRLETAKSSAETKRTRKPKPAPAVQEGSAR